MGKRGQGEGSIYKDKRTGRYRGAVMVNGRRKYFSGATRKAVLAKIEEFKLSCRAGLMVGGDEQTVAQYVEWWLEHVLKPTVQDSTYMCNRRYLKIVSKELGHHKLKDLRPEHIEQALRVWMERDGQQPLSVRRYTATLSQSLNDAIRRGIIVRNPCLSVVKPRIPDKEIDYYTEQEAEAIMRKSRGERLHALWILLISTGMRIGEARALTWDDIDFQRRTILVRHSLKYNLDGKLLRGSTKTASSRRSVLMSELCARALREQHATIEAECENAHTAGRDWDDRAFIFTSPVGNGAPIPIQTVHAHLERLCKRIGLPKYRIHALRHTCATLLLQKGANVKQVSEMLGHKDITMTLRVYSHVTERMHRQAVGLMNEMFPVDDLDNSAESGANSQTA